MARASVGLLLAALLCCSAQCSFDTSGLGARPDLPLIPDSGPTPETDGAADSAPADRELTPEDGSQLDPEPPPACPTACPLGCNPAESRCYRLQPTNFSVNQFFDNVTATLGSAGGPTIRVNTEDGSIEGSDGPIRPPETQGTANGIYWSIAQQPGSDYPDISIFGFAAVNIPAGTTVRITGDKSFALYAKGDVIIDGTLEANADKMSAGPGGSSGGLSNSADAAPCFGGEGRGGNQAGYASSQIETGGGGGGRKASGGAGGESTYVWPDLAGGSGGSANGDDSLSPLYGGCGGGAGGGPDTWAYPDGEGGYGGGGGGAVQVAADGTITVTGTIIAAGAGGEGGTYGAGGGGGGSGGAIFLEAVSVAVSGILAANGGGGGAASPTTGTADAESGSDGQPSTDAAPGGGSPCAGGDGGARSTEGGAEGETYYGNTGGGGGSAGRIRINAQSSSQIQIGDQNASPAPHLTTTLMTW